MKHKIKKMDNVVVIGKPQDIELYEHSILTRMEPRVYNEFGCILLQVTSNKLDFVNMLIRRFRYAGLLVDNREKKPLKAKGRDGGTYTLPDAYEITLKKIPILEMQESEEDE